MKDLIVKTVLITLASLVGVFLLTFGALALFSPITLAEVFDGTGGYSSSIRFYELQYEKTGEIDDLAILTVKINQDVDAELSEKYLEELINHPDFDSVYGDLSNKQFYYGKYAVALVKNDKFSYALAHADNFVKANGYTAYNPYSVILVELGGELNGDQLESIKESINNYAEASSDLEYIDALLKK